MSLVCPSCHSPLDAFHCSTCNVTYPVDDRIADFSRGHYYDSFDPGQLLTDEHNAGLALELDGTRRRIDDFYGPLIRRFQPDARRVLDCGCGNGLAVDLLSDHGYEAWGNDLSQLRKWQWRQREMRERLVVADGSALPFPDGFFDVVIASGVVEHIGVEEFGVPHYTVRPKPTRDVERAAFARELLRVTRVGGHIFIDCPNGAFPIDFWHGDAAGGARRHSRDEGFLPTPAELRSLFAGHGVEFLSPYRRLQFGQASRHWYGRVLGGPVALFFRLMQLPIVKRLAATPLNPFLVAKVQSRPCVVS
jgi:SAM-dependent methyltransferase